MKPSLCVVNYNGARHLPATLAAAREHAAELHEIVVFDNASTDGSAELAERDFPEVRVIRLGENRGPAPARNAALDQAGSDRVLIVDNDVRIVEGCARILSAALDASPAASIATPAVLYAHKPDTVQFDGADWHVLGQQILHHPDVPIADLPSRPRTIGSLITACFMVDRARLPSGMRFDESFFIYFEDHDFGVRARLLGSEILSVPEARCLHAEGTEGLSVRQLGKYSSMRVFCTVRNRWLFVLKNYSVATLLLLLPVAGVFELAQLALAMKKGWLAEWWQSLRWVVTHAGEIRRDRRIVQSGRVRSDPELMVGGPLPFRVELIEGRLEALGRRGLDALVDVYWRCLRSVVWRGHVGS